MANATKDFEAWKTDLQTDAALQEGIIQGLNFEDFSAKTRCPKSLQPRYEQLQAQAAAAERRKHNDFLRGFNMDDMGAYVPRELYKEDR